MNSEKEEHCSRCGKTMIKKDVTLLRKKKGKLYSFNKTPAQICNECGEQWFSTDTIKMIDELISGKVSFPHRTIEAIEFDFSA